MNYGEIKKNDIANGTGVRITLFVSGCRNRCKGCFQPETWDFSYGKEFTCETEKEIIEMLKPDYVNGLTLLGGDPFEEENQKVLSDFVQKVKAIYPQKTIWAYTGYTFEQLTDSLSRPRCEYTDKLLSCIDVLVDGRFEESLKDISLAFRGSSNQRIIDVPATLSSGEIHILNFGK